MNIFNDPKVISNLVDRDYLACSNVNNKLSSYVNLLKKEYITDLVIRECLDLPTQGLMVEWLDVCLVEYDRLMCYGNAIQYHPEQSQLVEIPMAQQCHASAAFHWALNPHFKMYTGFSSKANFHTWLMDGSMIYETTPIHRESYYGYLNKDPIAEVFLELKNIEQLVADGVIPINRYELFKVNFKRLLKL